MRAIGMLCCMACAAAASPALPASQHCGAPQIAGNWTRTDLIAFPHTRLEIVPLGGVSFAVLTPQLSARRVAPDDPHNGLASVLPNGTMEVNCTQPRWCRTIVGSIHPPKTISINTKYMIFGAYKGGANCSQMTMVSPPGSADSSPGAVYCNSATDKACPAPPLHAV